MPADVSGEQVRGEGVVVTACPSDVGPPAAADADRAAVPRTGEPRVDACLQRLSEVESLSLADQLAVLTDVHADLQSILDELEED